MGGLLAPALGGAADLTKVELIDLQRLPEGFRMQRLVFRAARKAFDTLKGGFRGSWQYLVPQLVRLVEQFLVSDRLAIPTAWHSEPLRRRILLALNLDLIVAHLVRHVSEQNSERLEPVFDEEAPLGSTAWMRTWYTTKPCQPTVKSQISHVVGDSSWEIYTANALEGHADVLAYAKNDHLGFQLHYLWNGSKRRYLPDFLIRFANGTTLALEIKGEDGDQVRAKRRALDAWVKAVNGRGGFGKWAADVAYKPVQVHDVLARWAGAGSYPARATVSTAG